MLELNDKVRSFVADIVGVRLEMVTEQTTLFGDLGVDGDDGSDFMIAFAEHFNVDISGYRHENYFGMEGISLSFPIKWVQYVLRTGTPEHRTGIDPISVKSLVRAASEGRWQGAA